MCMDYSDFIFDAVVANKDKLYGAYNTQTMQWDVTSDLSSDFKIQPTVFGRRQVMRNLQLSRFLNKSRNLTLPAAPNARAVNM